MTLKRTTTVGLGIGLGAAGSAALYRLWLKQTGAADPERVGYPPLGTLKPLAENLWIVDGTMVAGGLLLPIRMVVVRLASGEVLLHSPIGYTAAIARSIEAIGTIRHLVAPGIAHWTFLSEWQRAYPEATTWGVPGLRDRAQVRASGTRIDADLAEEAPPAWNAEFDQGIVPGGLGFSECYFFHKPSRTLLLCDLIQNLEAHKLPPVTRMAALATGATRGTTSMHVRAVLRLAGDRTEAAVRRLVQLEPERVVFAHGAIFETNAARRLRAAFDWLV